VPAQAALALPDQPAREYAIGKRWGDSAEWLGVVKGAQDALGAALAAQRELGDHRIGCAPIARLPRSVRAQARAGLVVKVRG